MLSEQLTAEPTAAKIAPQRVICYLSVQADAQGHRKIEQVIGYPVSIPGFPGCSAVVHRHNGGGWTLTDQLTGLSLLPVYKTYPTRQAVIAAFVERMGAMGYNAQDWRDRVNYQLRENGGKTIAQLAAEK